MKEMTRITSSNNMRYRALKKVISSARERRNTGITVIEGEKLLKAYMMYGGHPLSLVYSESGWGRKSDPEGFPAEVETVVLRDGLFTSLSGVATPTGFLALIAVPPPPTPSKPGTAVMLDGIQDPGNLGTIVRSSAATGVAQVWASRTSADPWSPRSIRAGSGAHFVLEIGVTDDLAAVAKEKGVPVVALDHEAETSIYDMDLRKDIVLILGSEGKGISRESAAAADYRAAIPMPGWREPLNAAMAASICLFEALRQKIRAS